MKKLKGFTLVELIVVTAIFSLIMVAVLSILNPIGEVYNKTANYEHMRAASDNLRMYIEDNIRYADKMQVVYNATDGDAVLKANEFIEAYKITEGATTTYYVGNNEANCQPLYIMKISNTSVDSNGVPPTTEISDGEITIYQYTNKSVGGLDDAHLYKSANSDLFENYYYHFDSSAINWDNAVLGIDVFRKGFVSGSKEKLPESDERFFKLSNTASFSFVNLREIQRRYDEATEKKYYNYDGVECDADAPGAIEVDKTKKENAPYKPNVNAGTGNNIYFIYTLPKFANEY
ncbi:MAG: type II secretion system protein [Oscillospiraceae bacterium]